MLVQLGMSYRHGKEFTLDKNETESENCEEVCFVKREPLIAIRSARERERDHVPMTKGMLQD